MLKIRFFIALLVAKLTSFLLKMINRGATAAPGLYALKIDPSFLFTISKELKYSIVVAGTNGKTTTTRIITSILKEAGIKYVHNRTGSNLTRGIASELINHFQEKNLIGIWEADEAALPEIINLVKPKILILTNLFRDQLDRYGEIDSLLKKWQTALTQLKPDSLIICNADDPNLAYLTHKLKHKVIFYGIEAISLGSSKLAHAADALICPQCNNPLDYKMTFSSHLGIYNCPQCNFKKPTPDVSVTAANLGSLHTKILIKDRKSVYQLTFNLPGVYNIYNALAAYALAKVINISNEKIIFGFKKFKPAFGRSEQIIYLDKQISIFLVKNPVGFNETLKILKLVSENQQIGLLFCLNDMHADSRDVSWIWDVDMKNLNNLKINNLIISGLRAEDMALRLKYSNNQINKYPNKQIVEKNMTKAINMLLKGQEKQLYILPTYTAMLEVRKILYKGGLVHDTWKD